MIYLDYAATSIKREEILREIFDNKEAFDGNPASTHASGRRAKAILESSREAIADSIGADPSRVIFTSGASESNNTVLASFRGSRLITSNIEHDSILNTVDKENTIFLKANKDGMISLEDLKEVLSEDVKLVSLMYVNNEVGSIQRVKEIGEFLEDKDLHFHIDAVQAYGHIDIDVEKIKCDSLSLSGHKIGGLNGFGILYLRDDLGAFIRGGEQEKDRRAGTSYTMGAYSMARAFEKTKAERAKIKEVKEYFIERLKKIGIDFEVNGNLENSSDHILNLYFPAFRSDFLLTYLDMHGVCASAGSACRAGSLEPSKTIMSMYDEYRALHSIRFSFGFTNTKEDIDKLIEILEEVKK